MALEAHVRERNGDLTADFLMKGVMGLVTIAVVYGPIFAFAWMLVVPVAWRHAFWLAGAVTLVFLVSSFWQAARGDDPLRGLTRLSSEEAARRELDRYVASVTGGGALTALNREGIAGLAWVLLSGPQSVVEAVRALRSKFPTDEDTLAKGQALLEAIVSSEKKGMAFVRVDHFRAAALLLRLGLVELRPGKGEDDARLFSVAKGREVVA